MNTTVSAEIRELVTQSPLFDADWYLETYPDVRLLGHDPLQHYLTLGWRLGRNPSALFNASLYLELNRDVAAAGINPLIHFLKFGQQEGRSYGAKFPALSKTKSQMKAVNPELPVDQLAAFVRQQLSEQSSVRPLPESLEQRLLLTQNQLEQYFLRCQAMEHELRQCKLG